MKQIAVLVLLLTLSACSLPVFFRVPVVQGNVVTADQVGQLRLGMNKKQVEYVLGTPLVKPDFENDRWDYVFYYRNPRAHVRKSKLNLYFINGKLSDIEGNEEYTAQVAKMQNQVDSDDNGQLPGGTGSVGAALSPLGTGEVPANDSDEIPRSDTRRPGVQPLTPADNAPVGDSEAGSNGGPLPRAGAPLPGNPASNRP